MQTDKTKTPLTIEQAKKTRQAFQKALEDGDIVTAKALVAKQLENVSPESGSYQDKPFLFQATGTDSNTARTPTAPIAKHLELRGNTVVWNQLVDTNTTSVDTISGHKYLTLISGVKSIITSDGTAISVSGGTDNVFALTKMFGAGKEPTSVVQFNRLFPLPYYAYNAGELKSCQSNKLITIGYNQFENLNQFIKVVAGQTYRLMYWNGTALAALTSGSIEEYDGAQTLIQTTTYDNLSDLHTVDNSYPDNGDKGIKLTDETHYVKIVSSSNTNILFNLAWDGSRADYESYVKHEYTLPNWTGKSARNVYDSYYPDGTKIQRVATIDGGNIDWGYNSTFRLFYADFYIAVTGIDNNTIGNVVCPIYETDTVNNLRVDTPNNHDKGIALGFVISGGNIRIGIRDDSYNGDTAAFKNAMSGVMINYELINSYITTTGQQTFPENVEVDDFGTMEFTTSEMGSTSNPIIPQGNQFFYPADYALLIDDLNNYTNGDVQVLAKKSDLADKQNKLAQSIDLTPTTQTLTLTANTRYALGVLTALDITFPSSGNDGDEIIIEFVSGNTATTLTLDNVNAIYDFNSVNTMSFIKLIAQYQISVSRWVVNSTETIAADPILENNSWATIKAAFRAGIAKKFWSVGDTKQITFDGYTYTVRIADMTPNRYAYSDGSGFSNNVFEFVELMATKRQMNSTATNVGGWAACDLRETLNETVFNKLPADLKAVISEVAVASSIGNRSTDISYSSNKLFLAAEYEIFGNNSGSVGATEGSPQFGYYTLYNTDAYRIKTLVNSGDNSWWELRSPNVGDNASFCAVEANGGIGGSVDAQYSGAVCPYFVL